MAERKLNLTTKETDDGGLVVSWSEYPKRMDRESYPIWKTLGVMVFAVLLLIIAYLGNLVPLGLFAVALFGWVIFRGNQRVEEKNSVTFTPQLTIVHGYKGYQTAEITRFETGRLSTLKGSNPPKDGAEDPYIIQMWLDDVDPVQISKSNWDRDASNAIRASLDAAWRQIKDAERMQREAETYGQVSPEGLPDYD